MERQCARAYPQIPVAVLLSHHTFCDTHTHTHTHTHYNVPLEDVGRLRPHIIYSVFFG